MAFRACKVFGYFQKRTPVSQTFRPFSVPEFPLYLQNAEVLSHPTSQSSRFFLHQKHTKRSALHNKRIAGGELALRAEKLSGLSTNRILVRVSVRETFYDVYTTTQQFQYANRPFYHNTLCLSPESWHKHCFCFLLGPLKSLEKLETMLTQKSGIKQRVLRCFRYGVFRSGLHQNLTR